MRGASPATTRRAGTAPSVIGVILLLAGLFGLACSGEPRPDPAEPPAAAAAEDAAAPGDVTIVPAAEGPYDEMWAPLRDLQTLVQPLATESAEQMLQTLREQGGSAPAGSVSPQPMIIRQQGQRGETLWMVFYTDSDLLQAETYAIEQPTAEALKSALYSAQVTGAALNPYTRVSKREVFNYNVDKLYLAGLVGYLTAADARPGRHWEAANTARAAGKPFETLHHALRSLEEQEEWSRCEPAKLWAMWELDFPGSRDMALEELMWFIGEGNDTDQTRALLERFRAEAGVDG